MKTAIAGVLSRPLNTSTIVLGLGLLLGILGDQLIPAAGPTGLGWYLWIASLTVVAGWVSLNTHEIPREKVYLGAGVAFAAICLCLFRTIEPVLLLLWFVVWVAFTLILLSRIGETLTSTTLVALFVTGASVPLRALLGAFSILGSIDFRSGARSPGLLSGLRGALLALPLLVVFVALFSSADAAFERLSTQLFELVSSAGLRHLIVSLGLAWLVTGLLSAVIFARAWHERSSALILKFGSADTAVFLGLLFALFLLFVLLQLGYLFGGRETIEATSGLTLAEYARRGFFEMLVIAALTLLMLVYVSATGCDRRVFRPLATGFLVLISIILVSALQRLILYIDEFGLTIDRLTALAVMAGLACGIGLFAATMLRGQQQLFAGGLAAAGVVIVFAFALANPAAIVSRVNIERAIDNGQQVDIEYLLNLGSDAVPTLVESLDRIAGPSQCETISVIATNWYPSSNSGTYDVDDWRAFNFSMRRAARLIEENQVSLTARLQECLR